MNFEVQRKKFCLAGVLFFILLFSAQVYGEELNIAAPSNLKTILTEVSHFFEQKNPGWKVTEFYDSPAEIEYHIRGSAPLDVVIIDESNLKPIREIAQLEAEQLLFANEVVIIAQEETDLVWDDVKKSATEDPETMKKVALLGESTTLGKLSREYLKKVGITKVPVEKVVAVKHARGAVESVKNDEAKLAIIFASDAARSKKLKILARIPSSDIPGQAYFGAVFKSAKHRKAAELFLQTFQSTIVQQILRNAGFTLPPATK